MEPPPPTEEALAGLVTRLRSELDGLRRAMRSRAVIEQAKGVLIERLGLEPQEAFDQLVQMSQHANVKLAEVAAALVGIAAPDPTLSAAPEASEASSDPLSTPPRPATPLREPRHEALQAQHQLLTSQIMAATDADEIVTAIQKTSAAWPATSSSVVLTVLEPDGALLQAASVGLSPEIRSQWLRIPPQVEVPLTVAVRQATAIWLPAPDHERFPVLTQQAGSAVALPLFTNGQIVGALGLSWAQPQEFTDEVRRYLQALASVCARAVARQARKGPFESDLATDRAWLPIILERLSEPACLLTPILAGDQLTDFAIEHANPAAREFADLSGIETRSLLNFLPSASGLIEAFGRVLSTGSPVTLGDVQGPREAIDIQAARVWDQVFMTWRPSTLDDQGRRHVELLMVQRERLETQHRAAEALRDALLPVGPDLAKVDGLEIRGICQSPEKTGRVAGDWYDVLPLPDGTTVLALGDVTGEGLPATTAAATLRNALRAYALLGLSPAELLTALNKLQLQLDPEHVATLIVARYTPKTQTLAWAASGQAAPVRYRADGGTAVLAGPLGLPLGAAPDFEYAQAVVELAPDDRVLLYTDGLVLRRDSHLADGLTVLLQARASVDDLDLLVEHLNDRLGSLPDDDLCAILARVTS